MSRDRIEQMCQMLRGMSTPELWNEAVYIAQDCRVLHVTKMTVGLRPGEAWRIQGEIDNPDIGFPEIPHISRTTHGQLSMGCTCDIAPTGTICQHISALFLVVSSEMTDDDLITSG